MDDLKTPDIFFYLFDRWAVLDVETETAYFMTLPDRGLDASELEREWLEAAEVGIGRRVHSSVGSANNTIRTENVEVSVTGPQFEQMVRDVQRFIARWGGQSSQRDCSAVEAAFSGTAIDV